MKVLILSSPHAYKTAGIVSKDLLDGFKQIDGIEAKLIVKDWGKYNDTDIISMDSFFAPFIKWVMRKIKNIFRRLGLNTSPLQGTDRNFIIQDYDHSIYKYSTKKILQKVFFNPDIIIILFMQNFLNFKNFYQLNQYTKSPILLYMMDMAPMTGGCHYAWDCKGFTKNCGNCPGLFSNNPKDQTYLNWKFKKAYIDKTNIIPIAGTEWQYKQLQKSTLFVNKEKFKIILPIDEKLFKPANRNEIRKKLNLPLEKKIVFIGAVNIDAKRKGFKELIESLKILKSKLNFDEASNIHLVITGKENDNFKNLIPFEYTPLGYHLTHQQIAMVFQASDLFVCPSIEDSGPMMINQSIMCGTPVVSFEMGVALDLVITGQTGYSAKLKDSADLAAGIKYLLNLDEDEYKKMSDNCRTLGLNLCHPQKQSKKFIEIIQKSIE